MIYLIYFFCCLFDLWLEKKTVGKLTKTRICIVSIGWFISASLITYLVAK